MQNKTTNIRKLTGTAMLGAVAAVLMYMEFPFPIMPSFVKLVVSELPALLAATRGTGIASSLSAGYAPWAGAIVTRQNGSMVSDRAGVATPYAMQRLQARGNFFVEPQSNVYEGQVVGINNKPEELDVNITLAKHMTNMRSSTADVLEALTPPIKMSLEESLDFANEDECVEVTPESIRVRKIILGREDWYKWRAKQRRQNNNA